MIAHLQAHSNWREAVVLHKHKAAVAVRGAHVARVKGLRIRRVGCREQRGAIRCTQHSAAWHSSSAEFVKALFVRGAGRKQQERLLLLLADSEANSYKHQSLDLQAAKSGSQRLHFQMSLEGAVVSSRQLVL